MFSQTEALAVSYKKFEHNYDYLMALISLPNRLFVWSVVLEYNCLFFYEKKKIKNEICVFCGRRLLP